MADPVMGNLPLRRLLGCIFREYRTRKEILKAYSMSYPLDGWIHFSDAMRKKAFKEERESDFDRNLSELVELGYVQAYETRVHPVYAHIKLRKAEVFYKLTDRAQEALASIKRR